ncbi:MAG TPA: hypothetical protein VKZ75_11930 [Cyclobacteriaceae bacterium]|nr:hypothetical protein [Cyclobacteriaceae bacterium]
MKQKLEDFVRQNRDAFDDKVPNEKIWKSIAAGLPDFRRSAWNNVTIWRVAAMLFMALSFYLVLQGDLLKVGDNKQALNEFKDVEAFYVQQISEKVRIIDSYEEAEGLNGFTVDIHQLEAMYMVLKEEMQARPSQKVKDALVLNLLVRIDLLNKQLHRLDTKVEEEQARAS